MSWDGLDPSEVPGHADYTAAVQNKDLQWKNLEPAAGEFLNGECYDKEEAEAYINMTGLLGIGADEHPSRNEINALRAWNPGKNPTIRPTHMTIEEIYDPGLRIKITWSEESATADVPAWAESQLVVGVWKSTNGYGSVRIAGVALGQKAYVDQNVNQGEDVTYYTRYENSGDTSQFGDWSDPVSLTNIGAGIFTAGGGEWIDGYSSSQIETGANAPTGGTTPYAYEWFRSTDGTNFVSLGASSQPYILNGGLTPETRYWYYLEATDNNGAGDTVVYATVNDWTLAVPALSSVSATKNDSMNTAQGHFTTNSNVEVVEVEAWVNGSLYRSYNLNVSANTASSTDPLDDSDLNGGDSVYFVLTPRGKNLEYGTAVQTNTVTLDADVLTPDAPTMLTAQAQGTLGRIDLAWQDANTGEKTPDGWHVYVDGNYFDSTTTKSYTYSGVDGVQYCFTVTAYNTAGESLHSNQACDTAIGGGA